MSLEYFLRPYCRKNILVSILCGLGFFIDSPKPNRPEANCSEYARIEATPKDSDWYYLPEPLEYQEIKPTPTPNELPFIKKYRLAFVKNNNPYANLVS